MGLPIRGRVALGSPAIAYTTALIRGSLGVFGMEDGSRREGGSAELCRRDGESSGRADAPSAQRDTLAAGEDGDEGDVDPASSGRRRHHQQQGGAAAEPISYYDARSYPRIPPIVLLPGATAAASGAGDQSQIQERQQPVHPATGVGAARRQRSDGEGREQQHHEGAADGGMPGR